MSRVRDFLKSEDGSTAIEYSLIASIIGLGIILGMQGIRSQLQSTLTKVQTELKNAGN